MLQRSEQECIVVFVREAAKTLIQTQDQAEALFQTRSQRQLFQDFLSVGCEVMRRLNHRDTINP